MILLDAKRLTSTGDIMQRPISVRNPSKSHAAAVSLTTTRSEFLRVDGKRARFVRIPPSTASSKANLLVEKRFVELIFLSNSEISLFLLTGGATLRRRGA